MKRMMIIGLIAITLWGCTGNFAAQDDQSVIVQTNTPTNPESFPNVNNRYLTQSSDGNVICVKLPDSVSDNIISLIRGYTVDKLEEITEKIFEFSLTDTYLNGAQIGYENYWIDMKITAGSNQSFIFDGMFNYRGAAHPNHLRFALNLNEDEDQIYFRDLYHIDHALYETFASIAKQDIINEAGVWPDGWGDFGTELCSEEEFLEGMLTEVEFSWYPTPNGISIIYPVPHTMGDYRDVLIPIEKLHLTDKD